MDKLDDSFCFNCYYLFRVRAESVLSTSMLLHSEGSSVPLREGKVIRETLDESDFE